LKLVYLPVAFVLSNSLSISWKEVLGGGGSNPSISRDLGITAVGGYGVEKLVDCTEVCGGH